MPTSTPKFDMLVCMPAAEDEDWLLRLRLWWLPRVRMGVGSVRTA